MRLKIESARRQLGMATDLFLKDLDPVSVQCLAGGAGEVMEYYAEKSGKPSFMGVLLQTNPDAEPRKMRRAQRMYWAAFKHASRFEKGVETERDDEETLAEFSDERNEEALLMAWADYGTAVGMLPVEAQAFQVWTYARRPPKGKASQRCEIACNVAPVRGVYRVEG